MPHFPKSSRYSLGSKIDALLIEISEAIVAAAYLLKEEKLIYVKKAIIKLDMLKFFLLISWEINALDNKKYITLSEKLDEIGKMLGGWIKHLSAK